VLAAVRISVDLRLGAEPEVRLARIAKRKLALMPLQVDELQPCGRLFRRYGVDQTVDRYGVHRVAPDEHRRLGRYRNPATPWPDQPIPLERRSDVFGLAAQRLCDLLGVPFRMLGMKTDDVVLRGHAVTIEVGSA